MIRVVEQLRRLEMWQAGGEERPILATTTGQRKGGTYLIPFSQATSPLATLLDGENGEETSNPGSGTLLATSPPPRRGGGEDGGEEPDGVAT